MKRWKILTLFGLILLGTFFDEIFSKETRKKEDHRAAKGKL